MTYVKNLSDLITTELRRDILTLVNEGFQSADPVVAVKKTVKVFNNKVRIFNELIDLSRYDNLIVLGFGKASFKMALGLEQVIGDKINSGIIIAPKGIEINEKLLKRIKVLYGNHPYPSKDTITSSLKLIELAKQANEKTLVFILISGGGSALFEVLPNSITLDELTSLSKLLIKSGADIKEINTVRKHVSLVKGGQLVKYLNNARVISLIISDVVGDPIEFIASGPTAPDPTTFNDAKNVLIKYNLLNKVPKSVRNYIGQGIKGKISETPKPGDPLFKNVSNYIIASNIIALKSIAKKALDLGYTPLILTPYMEGEAREVGKFIASIIKSVKDNDVPIRKPAALIMGGETTVTVKGTGKGGRNQELALSVAINIKGLRNVVFASFGSDGIDGITDAAGAVVDGETVLRAQEKGLNPIDYLYNNDSYTFFSKIGNHLIFTGITGTNVNDIAIALIK